MTNSKTKKDKLIISPEIQQQAMAVAKATQKPNQTKEQTKLIAQGVEKGIAEYKKREKAKAREADKQKKKALKEKSGSQQSQLTNQESTTSTLTWLPWGLLIASWLGFVAYLTWF
ncbi:DUF2956 domain-containing protein [Saccharobesus litoralis]|uniref:DUF2956 domain-containing protein n=1 Tax=Saccharobesus litoralis TaxID=2172099 RepID=A0A2S0VQE1_9ALTE|nr:DUF2956 domain-containing protein [Saccharobesus litoralis]AWB66436.1 DUF2956 domain-containing protein [Saccharobesus litoralis]